MRLSTILATLSIFACVFSNKGAEAQGPPKPQVISHDGSGENYVQLLSGPPETVTMRSGRVILNPGKSIGKHSTGENEEILVILEGQGEMRITGGATFQLNKSVVAYCPPNTEHDVLNIGTGVLRYVYIVARAR